MSAILFSLTLTALYALVPLLWPLYQQPDYEDVHDHSVFVFIACGDKLYAYRQSHDVVHVEAHLTSVPDIHLASLYHVILSM